MVTEALGDDFQTVLSRLCTYATNAGTSWLQYWESDGKLKMTEHKANQCAAFTDLSVQAVCDCLRGKISAGDCLQQVGKNTLTVTSSMAYATAGQALIPIPVVGAVVGGLAGYALTAGCLASLMEARESARLAHEERLRVEAECNQAIAAIRSYRAEMNRYTTLYFTQQRDLFNASFAQMKKALMLDDVDGFIDGVNHITRGLGGDVEFNTLDEFETRMDDDTPFKL